MIEYNKGQLGRAAKELGFVRDTFEKVLRLKEILMFINTEEYLEKHLVLKVEYMKHKINKKTRIRIICFLLVVINFCVLGYLCSNPWPVALKKSKLYPYIDKMEMDTFIEKNNNPESCYQTVNGNIYLLHHGDLYKASVEDDRMYKVRHYIRSFLVTGESIFYCTEMGSSGNSLHRCDLDGSNDEILYKNVDACTMLEENILLLSGHIEQWTLGTYDLKNNQFREIDIKGNASPKKTCFHDNLAIYADTYDISTVDTDSGEVEELWSLYDDHKALAKVTCLYVYDDKIYFGVDAVTKKANSVTGLWRMDLDGKNQEQLTKEKIYEICFVGGEYIIPE